MQVKGPDHYGPSVHNQDSYHSDCRCLPLGHTLHAGCNVDSVAVDTLPLLEHIPMVDANAKIHPAVLGQLSLFGFEYLLDELAITSWYAVRVRTVASSSSPIRRL